MCARERERWIDGETDLKEGRSSAMHQSIDNIKNKTQIYCTKMSFIILQFIFNNYDKYL
jgi:hypothetical protein